MNFSRRQFVKGGVTAFTFGFAAPQMLCDIALAQGVPSRNLVVVYLSGGNDSLSTVIPYRDPFYASRRPTLAVPAGNVLQIGLDSSNVELGLHPRLTAQVDLRRGAWRSSAHRLRHRAGRTSPGSTSGHRRTTTLGTGCSGRYLDQLQAPIDPLVAWNTQRETPRPLAARLVGVPAITSPATYAFSSPNSGAEAGYERTAQTRISSHIPVDRPHLAFVNSTTQAALGTLDRVATVATYQPSLTYPNNGFSQALRAVAGAMNKRIGTKVFWVQTGGFDTHASQGANAGAYVNLMATLGDGLKAFYDDLSAQGMLNDTVVLLYSEFGRRISENGICPIMCRRKHMMIGLVLAASTAGRSHQDRQTIHSRTQREVNTRSDSVASTPRSRWLARANSVAILAGLSKRRENILRCRVWRS